MMSVCVSTGVHVLCHLCVEGSGQLLRAGFLLLPWDPGIESGFEASPRVVVCLVNSLTLLYFFNRSVLHVVH